MTKTLLSLAILLALGLVIAPAEETKKPDIPSDVLFYCSFDGTLEPEIQRGDKGFRGTTPPDYVKGHKGKALVTGHARNAVYPLKGNLDVAKGTIKFWVMPLDWKVGDNLFHHFLTIPEELPEDRKGDRVFSVLLYKFWEWDDLLAYGMAGELTTSFILRAPMEDTWSPKKWHQIAFTWEDQGACLYVDGKGASRKYMREAPKVLTAQSFTIGGPYFIENRTLTAIDELYIYNRKLPEQEIEERYRTELIESVMRR